MGGIRDNVWGKVYPEVEVDDNLGVGLCPSVSAPMIVVGVDDTGSGFVVGAFYVEVKRGRGGGAGKEEAIEGFA